ncbi:hypothetical protein EMCRGX_G009823 [Ephydatia muelleri]
MEGTPKYEATSYQAVLQAKMAELQDLVEAHIVESAHRQKVDDDRHSAERPFEPGDLVWLSVPTAGKLDPRMGGELDKNEVVKLSCNEAILLTTCLATEPHCLDTAEYTLNADHEVQVQLWMSRIESKASSGDDGQEEMKKPDCDKDNCNKKYCPQCRTDVLEVIKAGEKL